MRFIEVPPLVPLEDGFRFRLAYRMVVDVGIGRITVPAGFVTDLASTPRLMWAIVPPLGRYMLAAIVHDYLYPPRSPEDDRSRADGIFLKGMRALGVPRWQRGLMWLAVRVFGGRFYRPGEARRNL